MWTFIKNLIQLLLSPENGWKDLAHEPLDPDRYRKRGFIPLIAVTALTEFCQLFYVSNLHFVTALERCVLDFGCYYVAMLVCRLIMEMYVPRLVDGEPDVLRIQTVALYGVGLMAVTQIIVNCFPPGINILKFIPLYILLIVYQSTRYLNIKGQSDLYFGVLVAGAVVIVPMLLYSIMLMIVV